MSVSRVALDRAVVCQRRKVGLCNVAILVKSCYHEWSGSPAIPVRRTRHQCSQSGTMRCSEAAAMRSSPDRYLLSFQATGGKRRSMEQQQAIRDASTQRLGQRLRRARLTRNLTQGEVARNQFSVSYVSAVERGQIRPSLGALEKLAERLQVPITDLLGDTDFEA